MRNDCGMFLLMCLLDLIPFLIQKLKIFGYLVILEIALEFLHTDRIIIFPNTEFHPSLGHADVFFVETSLH